MKNTMKFVAATTFASLALFSATASADVFGKSSLTSMDDVKDFVVAGIALTEVNAPIANNTKGYAITLHTRVGGNKCLAAQRDFQVTSQNTPDSEFTRVSVESQAVTEKACQEIYAPAYSDLEGYVATNTNNVIQLDTNTQEQGIVTLLGRTGTVIQKASAVSVRDLNGSSDWVAMRFDASAIVGSNPCVAAGNTLAGFGYSLNGRLHVVVEARAKDAGRICTREYAPVSQAVTFDVAYKPGTVKEIVIENKDEMGQQEIIRLPSWAP